MQATCTAGKRGGIKNLRLLRKRSIIRSRKAATFAVCPASASTFGDWKFCLHLSIHLDSVANKSFTPVSGRDEKCMNKGYKRYGRVLAVRPGRQCSLADSSNAI